MSARAIAIHGNEMSGERRANLEIKSECPALVISPSWKTEQISVGKCAHRGASARRERQTSFKIVTWTKQTCTKHHNIVYKIEGASQN